MSKVLVTREKLDTLASIIGGKADVAVPLTIDGTIAAAETLVKGGGGGDGSDYIRTVVCPQQNFSNASMTNYAMLTDAARLVDGGDYIITYDGTEYVCTCEELWGSDRFLGSISLTWNNASSDVIFPFCVEDWNNLSGPAVHAMDSGQHSIKIERLELLTTGTIHVPKTITANGTYDPADDNADGYSEVTVNVPTGGTPRTSSDLTVSGATVTAPAGTYATAASKSVASGTVTAPASISGTAATVSTGTNTLTLTKTVSVTPSVTTAGYVSSGTAGNSSVSLTASVTTQAAQTIYPSSTDQTISSGRYLTGTQTIKAVTTSNLTADNIKSGVTVTVGDSSDADRVLSVTGTYSGGGGSVSVDTKTVTASNYPVSISFSSMNGEPKYFFLRSTSQISSSGSTTYYYIIDLRYNGNTNKYCDGNVFRIGSTRRVDVITTASSGGVVTGYTWSYSGTTLTITSSAASRSASPGAFNNTYELVYIY